jgi:hypothetical protein
VILLLTPNCNIKKHLQSRIEFKFQFNKWNGKHKIQNRKQNRKRKGKIMTYQAHLVDAAQQQAQQQAQ